MFGLFITPVLATVLTMGSGFALVEDVEVPIMERWVVKMLVKRCFDGNKSLHC